MSNPTVPAAAEGMPQLFDTTINPAALGHLSIYDLVSLYDALKTIMDVAQGLACQPKFNSEKTTLYNDAGEQFDLVSVLAESSISAIAEELKQREPTNRDEATVRALTLFADEAGHKDDLSEFADFVAAEVVAIGETRR